MGYVLPAKWARVERMYFEGEHLLKDIAATCDVSLSALRKRIKTRGWPPLRTLELSGDASVRARLRRAIAAKLTRLEKRMEKPDTDTATDSERQAREFASLMTTVDKLDAKEATWKGTLITTPTDDTIAPPAQGEDHVQKWREELARRIHRLERKRPG